jgi:hypothetical protein
MPPDGIANEPGKSIVWVLDLVVLVSLLFLAERMAGADCEIG